MVNFESDVLLTTNKGEILNIVILGRRDEVLNTFQSYMRARISNSSSIATEENKLRASLFVLFLEIEIPLSRRLLSNDKRQVLDELKEFVYSIDLVKPEDLIKSYNVINKFLDDINLTKIDTKKKFDSRLVEDENTEKGL